MKGYNIPDFFKLPKTGACCKIDWEAVAKIEFHYSPQFKPWTIMEFKSESRFFIVNNKLVEVRR